MGTPALTGRAGEIPVSVWEFLLHNESALWDLCMKGEFLKTGVHLVFYYNDIFVVVWLSSPKLFLIRKSPFAYTLYLDSLYKHSFLSRLCFRIISSNL